MIHKYYNNNVLRNSIFVVLLVAIAFLFFNLISGSGVQAYFLLRDELLATQGVLAKLRMQELQLSRDIRLLRDDNAYIEEQVKKNLYYLAPNELLYMFEQEQKEQ